MEGGWPGAVVVSGKGFKAANIRRRVGLVGGAVSALKYDGLVFKPLELRLGRARDQAEAFAPPIAPDHECGECDSTLLALVEDFIKRQLARRGRGGTGGVLLDSSTEEVGEGRVPQCFGDARRLVRRAGAHDVDAWVGDVRGG